jgi:hypothetical protein
MTKAVKASNEQPINGSKQRFLRMLPSIRRQAQTAAKDVPFHRREEFIQDVLTAAFALFARLVERNLTELAYPTSLARYSIARVRSGRAIGASLNSRDVLSRQAQQLRGFSVLSLEIIADQCRGAWRQTLADRRQYSPADAAAFRLDFEDWMNRLSLRKRAVATGLAQGDTTSTAAKHFRVTDARISQIRRELEAHWQSFQEGERSVSR